MVPTDIRIVMPNRPGVLIAALKAIAEDGINILGAGTDIRPGEQWGFIHVLVEDPEAARRAIESTGFEVTSEHAVDVIQIQNRPGAILEATKPYGDSGQNIEVFYTTLDHLVIGTEQMRQPISGTRMVDAHY